MNTAGIALAPLPPQFWGELDLGSELIFYKQVLKRFKNNFLLLKKSQKIPKIG